MCRCRAEPLSSVFLLLTCEDVLSAFHLCLSSGLSETEQQHGSPGAAEGAITETELSLQHHGSHTAFTAKHSRCLPGLCLRRHSHARTHAHTHPRTHSLIHCFFCPSISEMSPPPPEIQKHIKKTKSLLVCPNVVTKYTNILCANKY